jgi:hypothetical protein
VIARISLVAGAAATALVLILMFFPFAGPARCLSDVGPGSEQTPPCPPFDQAAADRGDLVAGALLVGGPVLLVAGSLGLLVSWAPGDGRDRPSTRT